MAHLTADAVGAIPQVEVLAYHNMWNAYVSQVVAAANSCANAYERASDAKQLGGPSYPITSMKPIAWMHRVNAAALQKEWNNTGDIRIVLHPGTLLQESQNVVLKRCNQVLENVRRDCPGVSIPTAVPSGASSQVIGTLEQAGVIGVGVLRNIYQSAQGLLESAF